MLHTIKKIPPFIYRNIVRKLLPTTGYVTYNGFKIKPIKYGDKYLPPNWKNYDETIKPQYETALVNGLRTHVELGNHVIIIGGGYGVTACIASERTGKRGKVTCYEARQSSTKQIENTIALNNCINNITLHNLYVGKKISQSTYLEVEKYIDPTELPDCDILELDCEGAEKEILQNINIRPKIILVETHGIYNSPTSEIIEILKAINYDPVNVEIAEIALQNICKEKDIKVITAHRL